MIANSFGCEKVENIANCDQNKDGTLDPDELAEGAQLDTDDDGAGDACDNCKDIQNPDQVNSDLDGLGDACDIDDDNDGVFDDGDNSGLAGDNPCRAGISTDCDDNCPRTPNGNQADANGDSLGDACDNDLDGFHNDLDNCPNDANSDQLDSDGDGFGDVCDNCPNQSVADDTDGDGVGDLCDNCPNDYNPNQDDSNNDGIGDVCDNDSDGVPDSSDNCPNDSNSSQTDSDDDTIGDACDNCPNNANGPNCSELYLNCDKNGDGCVEQEEVDVGNQRDTDGDGIGDACE